MNHDPAVLARRRLHLGTGHVTDDELGAAIGQPARDVRRPGQRAHRATVGEQALRQMGAEESTGPGHERARAHFALCDHASAIASATSPTE